jgi:hypothetical protein
MANIETLKRYLATSRKNENNAATRLRRAQTIFDKHYQASQRLFERIESMETKVAEMSARLLGETK